MIPDVEKLLWDVDLNKLSLTNHYIFIIERILEFGDFPEVRWMFKNYSKEQIITVLKQSKRISPKSGNFFANYLNIPKEELQCMKEPFTNKQDRF